nr:hypothetical protein [Rhodococcus sp. 15-1154-1]
MQSIEEIRQQMRDAIERDRHLFDDVVISPHLQNAMRRAAQGDSGERGAA